MFNFFAANAMDFSEGSLNNSVSTIIESCFTPDVTKNGTSFVKRQIRLPNEEEARKSGLEFLSRCGFPATFPPIIIGAIDGMHVEVHTLKNNFLHNIEITVHVAKHHIQ